METIVSAILDQPSTRLPGSKRLEKRKESKEKKIAISKELYDEITRLTESIL
jgi:(2R)-3-sulfolactate dehydrogenase (NADP+)